MEWKKLLIKKELCSIKNKDTPWEKIIVKMPKGEYEGYHIECSRRDGGIDTNHGWVEYTSEHVFQLIKTKREPGSRHRRPKISALEFENIFLDMDKKLQRKDNIWLAEVAKYDDTARGSARRMYLGREYIIGSLDGNWLYTEPNEKKLISANTFELIKPMSEDDINIYKRMLATQREADYADRAIGNYLFKLNLYAPKELIANTPIENAQRQLIETCEQELEKIKTNAINAAQDFFQILPDVPENAIEQIAQTKAKNNNYQAIAPLVVIDNTERAIKLQAPTPDEPNREVWLPKAWVTMQEYDSNIIIVSANKKALAKLGDSVALQTQPSAEQRAIAQKYGFSGRALENVLRTQKENLRGSSGKKEVLSATNKCASQEQK